MIRAWSRETWLGMVSVFTVLATWQLAVAVGALDALTASSPLLIAATAAQLAVEPDFWVSMATSTSEFGMGFVTAALLGTVLGLAAGWYRRLGNTLESAAMAMYVTPNTALLPIIVLWFGFGFKSTTVTVFIGAFFMVFLNAMAGAKTTEAQLIRVARAFSASDGRIFRTIVLPGSVPFIISGLRLGVGRALIGVVIGELYAASAGLGYLIHISSATLQLDKAFVAISVLAAAGLFSNGLFSALERAFAGWRPVPREV